MRVLVAGGAGFIGSHLCERLLNDGHTVICVDNFLTSSKENTNDFKSHKNFTMADYDITMPLPASTEVEAVFHLASPASPNLHSKISYHSLPMETMTANVLGTIELLRFCKTKSAKFLFASSSEVYGDPEKHPQSEDYHGNVSTTGPRSIYDESKRFGETITAYFWRSEGVNARIARIFNTYGERMLREDMRMVVSFINQALKNEPITIFGDGKQTRSLCYVSDTVDGLVRLMFGENTNKEIVNIGSPDEHTVLDYANIISELTDSKSKIVFSEKLPQDDPKKRRPDITKAKELLGWSPKVPLEEGLKKTIDYFKK